MHGRVSGEMKEERGERRRDVAEGLLYKYIVGKIHFFQSPRPRNPPANEFRWLHYQGMVRLSAVAAGLHFHKKEQLAPLCIGSEIKPVETY